MNNFFVNIIVLISGYLGMMLLDSLDKYLGVFKFQLPLYIGVILIIIGFIIRMWATIHFNKNEVKIIEMKKHSKLITSGPYKYSRNPLYIGILGITLGFVFISGSVLGLVFIVLFFFFWDFIIRKTEEPNLLAKFGNSYLIYKNNVRRWL